MAGAVLALAGALAVLHANGRTSLDGDLPLTLSWTAPDGCPDEESVKRQVAQMVRTSSPRPSSEPIEARGVVRRNPDGTWSLELETKAGGLTGARTLSSKGCDDLSRAGAVVLALMINAAAPASEEVTAVAPAVAEPKHDPPVAEAAPAPSARGAAAHLRVAAAIDALLSVGQLPGVAEGAGIRLEAGIQHLILQAHAAAWLPVRVSSAANALAGGTFDLVDLGAALCGRIDLKYGFAVEMCAGAAAVWMRGTGFGVANTASSSDWWAAALAGGALRYRMSPRLEARLAGEVWALPFGRPSFALHDVGPVYAPAEGSGRVALGLQFYL